MTQRGVARGEAPRESLEQRVTVEGDRDPGALVEGRLEGEGHDHLADAARELLDASGAPGPELRADDEQHGNAERARLAGEHPVEIREIDAHEHVGALVSHPTQQAAVDADQRHEPRDHRREADDREIVRLAAGAQARALEMLASDAERLGARLELADLLEDARAVDVRARLAHDHHQLRRAPGG